LPELNGIPRAHAPLVGRLRRERDTVVSLSAGFTQQLLLVVTGVLTARLLGPEDRGYLALLLLIPAILWQAGSFGLPAAATFFVAGDPAVARPLLARLKPVVAVQVVVLLVVHVLVILGVTHGDPHTVFLAALPTLAMVPAGLAHEYSLGVLQGRQQFAAFNVLRILPTIILAPVAAVFYALGQDSLFAFALAYGVIFAVVGAAAVIVVRTRLRGEGPAAEPPPLRRILGFGGRAMLGASAPFETFRVDQAIVGLFLEPVALGLYVVALSFTNLPRYVAQSVGMVAYPRVASTRTREESVKEMWRSFWLAVPLYATVIVGLEIGMPWLVPFFFGSEFESAVPIARLLLINTLFVCARRVLSDASRGAGYEGAGSVAELVALVVLLLTTPVFLPLAEAKGVALALAVSSGAGLAFLVWRVTRPSAAR
jgi:O-antigen/teichoic acid export membrane protein